MSGPDVYADGSGDGVDDYSDTSLDKKPSCTCQPVWRDGAMHHSARCESAPAVEPEPCDCDDPNRCIACCPVVEPERPMPIIGCAQCADTGKNVVGFRCRACQRASNKTTNRDDAMNESLRHTTTDLDTSPRGLVKHLTGFDDETIDDARNEVKAAELRGALEAEKRIERIIESGVPLGDLFPERDKRGEWINRPALLAAIREGEVDALNSRLMETFGQEAALTDEVAALRAALRDTNEQIIRYGTSPDTYDWADMTARTRANAKLIGDDRG